MVLYLKKIIVACMLTIFLHDHVRNYISLVKIALAVLYNVFFFLAGADEQIVGSIPGRTNNWGECAAFVVTSTTNG